MKIINHLFLYIFYDYFHEWSVTYKKIYIFIRHNKLSMFKSGGYNYKLLIIITLFKNR